MATPPPVTRSEFLAYLNKDPSLSEDPELDQMLEAATEAAEGWHNVGPIVTRTVTQRISTDDCGRLVLPLRPVQSVTTATRVSDGTVFETDDLDVDTATGIVTKADGAGLPLDAYDIEYEAGRGTINEVSASLKLGVLIIAGHLWQTQQGPTTNRWPGQDASENNFRVSRGYLIPNRAAHLLQPEQNVAVM